MCSYYWGDTVPHGDFRMVSLMCPQHFDSKYGTRFYALPAYNYFNYCESYYNMFPGLSCFEVVSQLWTSDAVIVYSAWAFTGNHK